MKFLYTTALFLTIGYSVSYASGPQWETDFYALLTTVGKPWSAASKLLDTPSSINKVDADTEELIYSYCTIYVSNSMVTEIWFKEDPSEKCITYKREIFEGFTFCGGLFKEKLSPDIFKNFIGEAQNIDINESYDSENKKWIKTTHYHWLDNGLVISAISEGNVSGVYDEERISSLGIKSKSVAEMYLKSQNFPTKLNNLAFLMVGNKTNHLMEKLLGKPQANTQTDGDWEYYYLSKGFAFSYDNINESFTMITITNSNAAIQSSQYPHSLPFNLKWSMKYDEVVKLLGQADKIVNQNGQTITLYQQKSMIVYFEENTKRMQMIQFGKQSTSYLL